MKVKIAERHAQLSDPLKDYVLEKTQTLETYFDRIISVEAVLSVEKQRQIADFHAHLVNKKVLNAHEESDDMYASIDRAVDTLKRQLVEFKNRMQDKHVREGAEAKRDRASSTESEDDHPVIVRSDTYFQKPMTAEEAALQLDAVDKDFLVFVDVETDQVAIIYHRRDETYGLIEPRR